MVLTGNGASIMDIDQAYWHYEHCEQEAHKIKDAYCVPITWKFT